MAEHGEVEYATATGNDYLEHEATYEFFTHLAFVGVLHVVCVVIGLTLGGVMDHWLPAAILIVLASIAALHGLFFNSSAFIIAVAVLAFVLLALYGLS